ncbi:dehydrogenase/reductase SDR family member 11-like [Mytilus californianus]|uniref:dehydrogenase/reductase SDR family member 11-like n=1 Tax=Mytilus californianus TaxID=6549 RepID=UPI002245CB23|nr:dehydrogenase/reductase SDR family member 11-like [Mytilus californianus]
MERWAGRVALVTGASVGIGAAIVRQLVKNGMKVVGCSRNIDKIEALKTELSSAKGKVIPVRCDLKNEQDIMDMFTMIKRDLGGVDVCVNNAGLAHAAPLLSGETKDWREMVDVNIIGLTICTREAVKQMREKGANDGHVFLLNSMSGHRVIPSPNGHFYSATKFAVTALGDGIRNELREMKSQIRITSISPGLVETEFAYRMQKNDEKAKALYESIKCLQADDIADALVYALGAPAHAQVHDILIRPTDQVS